MLKNIVLTKIIFIGRQLCVEIGEMVQNLLFSKKNQEKSYGDHTDFIFGIEQSKCQETSSKKDK
jgi:hypothetical protein